MNGCDSSRSEEHTSELQSQSNLVCRLLLEKKKVSDLISRAEMEQNDYRRGNKPNVFFGLEKRYFGIAFGVFTFDTVVLIVSTLVLLVMLHWILRKQLEVRRT